MEKPVIEMIVKAIADAEDTTTMSLDIVLQQWVDTDAIRHLAAHDRSSWELEFETRDHTVRVTGDEAVFVDGVQRASSL